MSAGRIGATPGVPSSKVARLAWPAATRDGLAESPVQSGHVSNRACEYWAATNEEVGVPWLQAGVGAAGFFVSASPWWRCSSSSPAARLRRRRRTTTSRMRLRLVEAAGRSPRNRTSTQPSRLASALTNGDPGGHSIWYSLAAPDAGPFVITASGLSGNTILAVYTGTSLNNLVEEASNDNGNPSRVCVAPGGATTFSIAIDGYGGADGQRHQPDAGIATTAARRARTARRRSPATRSPPTGPSSRASTRRGSAVRSRTRISGIAASDRIASPSRVQPVRPTRSRLTDVSTRLRFDDHASNSNGSFDTASPRRTSS